MDMNKGKKLVAAVSFTIDFISYFLCHGCLVQIKAVERRLGHFFLIEK